MSRESFFPLFDWLGHTPPGYALRNSSALIALTEIVHLLGLTLLLGTIMMTDLCLLGVGFRRHPVARIARELWPWSVGGLAILLISGPLLLTSEAEKCYNATFFWIKMGLLAAALLFHFTLHRRIALAEPPASRFVSGLAGLVSLFLWAGVAVSAKLIGIIGDDLAHQVRIF